MTTAALTITQPSSLDPVNDPSAFIREAFVTLAAAFPSAKSDETYWTLLASTFADTPDHLLTAAVMAYIRETTYHVLPPLGRLIQLVDKAEAEAKDRLKMATDHVMAIYVELTERRKTAVIQAIPHNDQATVKRVMKHCYRVTPDYLQATALIAKCLDLSHSVSPDQDRYSPTGLLVDSLLLTPAEYQDRYSKPLRSTAAISFDPAAFPLPEILTSQGLGIPYRVSFPPAAIPLTAYVTEAEAIDEWSRTEGL